MNRRIPALLLAACFCLSGAFADTFFNKLRFSVKTLPDRDGGGFQGTLGYAFSDRLASMLYMKQLVTAETGELDLAGLAKSSLALTRDAVTEYFIMPLELTLPGIGTGGLALGAGGYISTVTEKVVGYFQLTDAYALANETFAVNNYYDYAVDATFYGPVITAETDFDFGFMSIDPRLVVVPIYFYTQYAGLTVDPLYSNLGWAPGERTYDSKGIPYVAFSMDDISFPVGKLFKLPGLRIGGSAAVEVNHQSLEFLNPTVDDQDNKIWTGLPAEVTATTLSYQAKIGYTFDNGSSINLGFGARTLWNAQKGGETTHITRPISSIAYDLHK